MVGRCDENLNEHTATKSYKQLATETFLTIAHHGANFIIDAIDPVGTVDERVYDRIGKIFDNLKDYEPYLDGNLLADVGVFFDSKIKNYSDSNPEFDNKSCSVNAVRTLIEKHIPTAVFANGVLDKIFDYKLVVAGRLKDFYTEYEDVLKEYVKNGGALYLSGKNNLSLMKEFFGAEFLGFTKETKTYVRPTKDFGEVLGEFTENYPMPVNYALPVYKVDDSCVKGYVTLPYTDPADYINFASIHSNPPGIKTQIPAIMVKDYGKGKVMWSACSIENETRTCFKEVFANVINYLIGKDALSVNVVTAKCVEAVFFKTKDGYLFSLVDLVNTEDEIAKDFTIKIKCDRKVKRVVRLPDLKDVPFICDENSVTVSGEVTNFDMYKIITE